MRRAARATRKDMYERVHQVMDKLTVMAAFFEVGVVCNVLGSVRPKRYVVPKTLLRATLGTHFVAADLPLLTSRVPSWRLKSAKRRRSADLLGTQNLKACKSLLAL